MCRAKRGMMVGQDFRVYAAGFAAGVAALIAVWAVSTLAMMLAGLVVADLRRVILEAPLICGAIVAASLPGHAAIRTVMRRLGSEGALAFAAGGAANGVAVYLVFVAVDPFGVRYGLINPITALLKFATVFAALGALAGIAAWFGERWMRRRIGRADAASGA